VGAAISAAAQRETELLAPVDDFRALPGLGAERRERDRGDLVAERPAQVLPDGPEGGTGQPDRVGDLGYLNPILASAAMTLSSVFVASGR